MPHADTDSDDDDDNDSKGLSIQSHYQPKYSFWRFMNRGAPGSECRMHDLTAACLAQPPDPSMPKILIALFVLRTILEAKYEPANQMMPEFCDICADTIQSTIINCNGQQFWYRAPIVTFIRKPLGGCSSCFGFQT